MKAMKNPGANVGFRTSKCSQSQYSTMSLKDSITVKKRSENFKSYCPKVEYPITAKPNRQTKNMSMKKNISFFELDRISVNALSLKLKEKN